MSNEVSPLSEFPKLLPALSVSKKARADVVAGEAERKPEASDVLVPP
jgi:hypothetical protein